MQIEERIVTIVCNAKDCGRKGISAGIGAKHDLVMQGWELDLELFEHKVDLCPDCKWELHEWSGVAALEEDEKPVEKDAEKGDPGEPICCCWGINPADGEEICEPCAKNDHEKCVGPLR